MPLKIYNTLTQKKENFEPIDKNHVKIYLCGPTVYSYLHIGNFRGPIFFNFVVNYFKFQGIKVTFVYNYTDIDDRIIKLALEEKVTSGEVSEKYISEFEKDFLAVGLDTFKDDPLVKRITPKVTEHITEIISIIEEIIKNGVGYVVDGEVFCSISKVKGYGKLSHKNIEDLKAGARVEIGEKKRDPLDFTLWKPAKPGEPSWDSPWGPGRPGWHIECSAMAKRHLGESFDIHGGGIDLIFPHHENEIAQSESASGKTFVNYWMHNNFINFGKDKMSKSLGNVFTARNFVKVYDGEILKFFILSSHYRSSCDFSEDSVNGSISGLARIYSALARAKEILSAGEKVGFTPQEGNSKTLDAQNYGEKSAQFWNLILQKADDDFNSPEVMAEVFVLVRAFNALLRPNLKPSQELVNSAFAFTQNMQRVGSLMALFKNEPTSYLIKLDDMLLKQKGLQRSLVQSLVDKRWEAKKNKDYKASDEIREELVKMGIEVRDSAQGSDWEVKK